MRVHIQSSSPNWTLRRDSWPSVVRVSETTHPEPHRSNNRPACRLHPAHDTSGHHCRNTTVSANAATLAFAESPHMHSVHHRTTTTINVTTINSMHNGHSAQWAFLDGLMICVHPPPRVLTTLASAFGRAFHTRVLFSVLLAYGLTLLFCTYDDAQGELESFIESWKKAKLFDRCASVFCLRLRDLCTARKLQRLHATTSHLIMTF